MSYTSTTYHSYLLVVIPGNVIFFVLLPYWRHCSDLFFRVKTLETGFWWLNPLTAILELRSLPEGIAVEQRHWPCGVKRCWCGYDRWCSLSIAVLIASEFFFLFFSFGHSFGSYDFALYRHVFFSVCVDVAYVHPRYVEVALKKICRDRKCVHFFVSTCCFVLSA